MTVLKGYEEMKEIPEEYKKLNKAYLYREFKIDYNHPQMHINSYRRVLYGMSTYLQDKGHSPYIADMFRFFGEKLSKPFVVVAYELLDSEYFGRKNTLLDVLSSETNLPKETLNKSLGDMAEELERTKLCELNEVNKYKYDKALDMLKNTERK